MGESDHGCLSLHTGLVSLLVEIMAAVVLRGLCVNVKVKQVGTALQMLLFLSRSSFQVEKNDFSESGAFK